MTDLDLMVARMKAAGALRVYKVGAVPALPGDAYAVLALDTGTAVNRRTSGHRSRSVRRLTAQLFGRSEEAVMDMAGFADVAFDEKALAEFPERPFCIREMPPVGPTRDADAESLLYVLHIYRF